MHLIARYAIKIVRAAFLKITLRVTIFDHRTDIVPARVQESTKIHVHHFNCVAQISIAKQLLYRCRNGIVTLTRIAAVCGHLYFKNNRTRYDI